MPTVTTEDPLTVVAVSGSLHAPSKTTALLEGILGAFAKRGPVASRLVELSEIGADFAGTLRRDELPDAVEDVLQAIEGADVLVVASPVYRASFTGLFKHLFDFIGQYALVGKPVLLAATGGSERHSLIIEHQLRPLFSFFQALTLPTGVYASASDFTDYTITSEKLIDRIETTLDRGRPLLRKFEPVSPHVSGW